MSEKIIIDGYNMLHLVDAYRGEINKDLQTAREKLLRDLQNYRAIKNITIIVVFDGSPDVSYPSNYRGIGVIFSHAPRKADPIIMDLIRKEDKKRSISIVTNDHEITNFARAANCNCLSPQEFYQRIKSIQNTLTDIDTKFDGEMKPEELAEWKMIFGIEK